MSYFASRIFKLKTFVWRQKKKKTEYELVQKWRENCKNKLCGTHSFETMCIACFLATRSADANEHISIKISKKLARFVSVDNNRVASRNGTAYTWLSDYQDGIVISCTLEYFIYYSILQVTTKYLHLKYHQTVKSSQ